MMTPLAHFHNRGAIHIPNLVVDAATKLVEEGLVEIDAEKIIGGKPTPILYSNEVTKCLGTLKSNSNYVNNKYKIYSINLHTFCPEEFDGATTDEIFYLLLKVYDAESFARALNYSPTCLQDELSYKIFKFNILKKKSTAYNVTQIVLLKKYARAVEKVRALRLPISYSVVLNGKLLFYYNSSVSPRLDLPLSLKEHVEPITGVLSTIDWR